MKPKCCFLRIVGVVWLFTCLPSHGQETPARRGRDEALLRHADPSPPTEASQKRRAREYEQRLLTEQPVPVPGSRRRTVLSTDFIVQDPRHPLWPLWQ